MNQSLCLGRGKAQFHRNSCIRRTDPIQQHLSMGKKAFSGPGEKEPTHPSGWALRGLWALLEDAGLLHTGVSLALQEGPLVAHIPWVPHIGRMLLPQHRGVTLMTFPCMQGMGQLS